MDIPKRKEEPTLIEHRRPSRCAHADETRIPCKRGRHQQTQTQTNIGLLFPGRFPPFVPPPGLSVSQGRRGLSLVQDNVEEGFLMGYLSANPRNAPASLSKGLTKPLLQSKRQRLRNLKVALSVHEEQPPTWNFPCSRSSSGLIAVPMLW